MFELVEAEFRGLAVDKASDSAEKALRWRHHLSSDDVRKILYGRVVILASSVGTQESAQVNNADVSIV